MSTMFLFYRENILNTWDRLEQTEEQIGSRTSSKVCKHIATCTLQLIKIIWQWMKKISCL